MSYTGTLETPDQRTTFTDTTLGKVVSSYCYNAVKQSDLSGLLAYCDGAGWTAKKIKSTQLQLTRSDELTPKTVYITVTGSLVLEQGKYSDNTGAVEIDWY